jgi:HPt (histidine-containing phosphotransfer) domain-containing protein
VKAKSGKIIIKINQDMEDLIPEYLDTRRQELAVLQKAIKNGEVETVRMIGHTLKGSGGGYGFDRITEIGALLEGAARKSDMPELQTQFERMQDYLARVEVRYIEESDDET